MRGQRGRGAAAAAAAVLTTEGALRGCVRVSGVSLICDTASPLSVVFTVRLLPCLGRGQRRRDTDTAIDTGAAMPFHQISAHRTACTSPARLPARPVPC